MIVPRRPVVIRNRFFVIGDLFLTTISAIVAFAIRLDGPLFWIYLNACLIFVLMCLAIKPPMFYLFGLYRRYWRYASVNEMLTIVGAITASSLVVAALVLGLFLPLGWFDGFPRSVLVIDWLLSLFLIGGIRFLARFLGEYGSSRTSDVSGSRKPRRVLVVGAGDAGAMIVREIRNNPGVGMEPIGYVDDNWAKVGMRIRGLPVLGTRETIPKLVRELNVDQVLIAMPTAPGRAIREIKEICESIPVAFKTIPGMYELLDGRVHVRQIRDVQIEDLLRREPVRAQRGGEDAAYLRDQVVLITGAGGSIGSELCRQAAYRQPRKIVLLGHGENSIYRIHQELSSSFPQLALVPAIADIRDKARLYRVFDEHRPRVVFHAAAHKHVPLMEKNAEEAISNNVLGTCYLLEVAGQMDVDRLVLVSTDKAVNPVSFMGATKRIAELLVQNAAHQTGRNFVAVRFGNVLGSRGSVVPLFKAQISAGGPVTVTHPEMERYFMTIPEAVYLLLQAASLGTGGELFILDMGEPVKIVDLARDLITLSGLQPDRDIEIRFVGMRPGEKLRESLFLEGEDYETTKHDKIFVSRRPLHLDDESLRAAVQHLVDLAQGGSPPGELWAAVKRIVPESAPSQDAIPTQPPLGLRLESSPRGLGTRSRPYGMRS
jgi:FlaA1/EpsC-like NDP-sugar epimerase